MRNRALSLLLGALGPAAVAGCSTTEPYALPETVPVPVERGIEGPWLSSDGSSQTRFLDGTFQTAALDTGKMLAEGAYAMTDKANVSIRMNSLVRRKTSKVNCLLVHAGQLNCTTEDRRQFVLMRPTVPL
jgi:hypothetical protein